MRPVESGGKGIGTLSVSRRIYGGVAAASLLLIAVSAANARPEFERRFLAITKPGTKTPLTNEHCLICHSGAPPVLNPFGKAVQRNLRETSANEVSESLLARFAREDSDGDGYSNTEEI